MHVRSIRTSIIVIIAVLAIIAFVSPLAKSQVQATPSYIPIGVSSAGNTSTVWFHEPYSRQALACQTVTTTAGLSSIQCVATKLP